MNITAATFNNNFLPQKTSANPMDKSIGVFEKQKNRLQEEIKKIDESDDEFETKKKKKDELQKQIEELDKQIAGMKLEKLKEPPETIVTLTSPPPEAQGSKDRPAGVPLAESRNFLLATSNYSQMRTLGKVRTDKLAEARIAIARGADPEEAMASVRILDQKIYEKAGQVQKKLSQSATEIAEKQTAQEEVQENTKKETQEEENENSVQNSVPQPGKINIEF